MKKSKFLLTNSQHIDKLNRITKEVLLSIRLIKNKNINNNLLLGINQKINSNFNKVNPIFKKQMNNILNEFSFYSRPLSSNQSNIFNYKLNEYQKKSNRRFSFEINQNKNNNSTKKSSLEMKKEEMMNLLDNNIKVKVKLKDIII